jgi:hypothetical protein
LLFIAAGVKKLAHKLFSRLHNSLLGIVTTTELEQKSVVEEALENL